MRILPTGRVSNYGPHKASTPLSAAAKRTGSNSSCGSLSSVTASGTGGSRIRSSYTEIPSSGRISKPHTKMGSIICQNDSRNHQSSTLHLDKGHSTCASSRISNNHDGPMTTSGNPGSAQYKMLY